MQPLNKAGRVAWRTLLSAVAGGGLTVAGAGGGVAAALGAGSGSNSGVPPVTNAEAPTATTGAPAPTPESTTPSTTPAPTTTGSAPTATTPAPATPAPTATTPAPEASSTTTIAAPPAPGAKAPAPATVVLPRKRGAAKRKSKSKTQTGGAKATGPNNVALPPALLAGQAQAIAAALSSSTASVQALGFYRIPLFLLPIYKAAAVQYGVPWQILAAINEIETDYGADQSVSTAGAVGWMQFMPETWLQYGVDALDAGYADPYNPVDAVFAAARYLRAAGASTNLRSAILAYNHSEEYVDSVLLRARLISSYPKSVIATLTGVTDGRLPVGGGQLAWPRLISATPSPSSATAGASAAPLAAPAATPAAGVAPSHATTAVTPGVAAKAVSAASGAASQPQQLAELQSSPNARVLAVEDGRVLQIGSSARLGRFIVLRDVYGDVFTYAGLGSVAKTYPSPKVPNAPVSSPAVEAASTHDPAPSRPATAGSQPLTLRVKAPVKHAAVSSAVAPEEAVAVAGKVRLFARPGNPDARAAAASVKRARRSTSTRLALRKGSVVAVGTMIGRVSTPAGAQDGHMRFAIRPAGDSSAIDPRPVLANWAQLEKALHPQGARSHNPLLGATASDVLLQSRPELERAVLADPGITLEACARREIAAGRFDRRVLAVLAFLSRSGLRPAASAVGCNISLVSGTGVSSRDATEIDITAINGRPIAGHQGAGTITDLTIRTLLTLPAPFVAQTISSLMRYPGAAATHASTTYWNRIRLAFAPATPAAPAAVASTPAAAARAAHAALATGSAPTFVSSSQWEQLIGRVGALPTPPVRVKPSSAAIPDPKHR